MTFMMSMVLVALCGLGAGAAFAGTDPDPDLELAMKSLRAIGADVDGSTLRCAGCHSLNIYTFNRWGRATDIINSSTPAWIRVST